MGKKSNVNIIFIFSIILFVFFQSYPLFSSTSVPTLSSLSSLSPLSPDQRDSLRRRLEELYNEVDLLIRNQKIDFEDLKKQEQVISNFRVYERIPFQRDIQGLKRNLTESARAVHLHFIQCKITHINYSKKKYPYSIYTDEPEFQFQSNQLVETIHFSVKVQGKRKDILNWIQSWPTEQLRLVEPDHPQSSSHSKFLSLHSLSKNTWEIHAHAFSFRDVRFPNLLPRNPRLLLPLWARKNTKAFSQAEPLLWSFVTRTERLLPLTPPLYKIRQEFLLDDARINFFLSKTMDSSEKPLDESE